MVVIVIAYFHQLIWMHLLNLVKTGKWFKSNIHRVKIHFFLKKIHLKSDSRHRGCSEENTSWFILERNLSVQAKAKYLPASHSWPGNSGMFRESSSSSSFWKHLAYKCPMVCSWERMNFQCKQKQTRPCCHTHTPNTSHRWPDQDHLLLLSKGIFGKWHFVKTP